MKSEKQIPLSGLTQSGDKPRSGKEVFSFADADELFNIRFDDLMGSCELTTDKGTYTLIKHNVKNLWTGTCAGIKVHITRKVFVGKLIYWA